MTFYLLSHSLSSTLAHSFSLSTHISSPHRLKFSSWRQTVYHTLSPCPHVQTIMSPPPPPFIHIHTLDVTLTHPSLPFSLKLLSFSSLYSSCILPGSPTVNIRRFWHVLFFLNGKLSQIQNKKETVAALNIKRLIILEWHFMLASFVFNLPSSRPPRAGYSNNWVHYNQLLYDSSDKINKAVHQHHTHTKQALMSRTNMSDSCALPLCTHMHTDTFINLK